MDIVSVAQSSLGAIEQCIKHGRVDDHVKDSLKRAAKYERERLRLLKQ